MKTVSFEMRKIKSLQKKTHHESGMNPIRTFSGCSRRTGLSGAPEADPLATTKVAAGLR